MELGNMMFEHSRGNFEILDRYLLIDSDEWQELCKKAEVCSLYGTQEGNQDFYGYDNKVFTISPYWWGNDNAPKANRPNFLYKPTGFEIKWYKYAFRDAYMNQDLTTKEVLEIFKRCAESIKRGD